MESKVGKAPRDLAIDRLRGALVIIMVLGDYIAGVNWIPNYLKHAPDIGFTIADAVAPAFVFVIGLNYELSFLRRYAENKAGVYRYFVMRYLSILGIGAIITAGADLANRPTGWGVLESLGVAGLITLAVIRFPVWVRASVGILILCGYQFLLDAYMLESVMNSGHGGFFGSISWASQLILATCVAAIYRKGMNAYLICNAVLWLAAWGSAWVVPISKNRVSLSFIVLTLALTSSIFLVMKVLDRFSPSEEGILIWWGRNSLGLYLIHLLVLSLFGLPAITWWYAEVPVWLFSIQVTGIVVFMSFIAHILYRNQRKKRS